MAENHGRERAEGWLSSGWFHCAAAADGFVQWGHEGWGGHLGSNNLINVTPLLSLAQANASLADAAAYARAYGGSAVIETLPTWYASSRSFGLLFLPFWWQERLFQQGQAACEIWQVRMTADTAL
jgi:hypothetical protein